jgi:hypothetical protein
MGSFRQIQEDTKKFTAQGIFVVRTRQDAAEPTRRRLRKSTRRQAENPDNGRQFVFALW